MNFNIQKDLKLNSIVIFFNIEYAPSIDIGPLHLYGTSTQFLLNRHTYEVHTYNKIYIHLYMYTRDCMDFKFRSEAT